MYKFKRILRNIYYFFHDRVTLKKMVIFTKEVVLSVNHYNVFKTSASMIYYTLVTAVPFLALLVPILNMLGSSESFYLVLERFLGNIIGEEYANALASHIVLYTSNTATLGVLSTFVFFYSSILLINKIYKEINHIYQTPKTKDKDNLFKRFFSYVVFLIVFIIFVAVFLFSIGRIVRVIDNELTFISLSWISTVINSLTFRIIIVFLVLYGAICMIPKVYVSGKDALYGAVFAEIGIFLLSTIMQRFVNVLFRKSSVIYGSVASIFVFLFWLYWVWNIFLIGVTISYVAQYRPDSNKSGNTSIAAIIERSINMMSILGISFMNATGGVTLSTLARELHLPSYEVLSMADKLVEGGLIYPIGKLKNRMYALALPPDKISVYFMVKIILGSSEGNDIGAKVLDSIDRSLADISSVSTLKDIIA